MQYTKAQLNKKLFKLHSRLATLDLRIAACNCEHTAAQLQDTYMQLITQEATLCYNYCAAS